MEIKNDNKIEEESKSPNRTSRLSILSISKKSPKKKKNDEKIKKKTSEDHIIEEKGKASTNKIRNKIYNKSFK